MTTTWWHSSWLGLKGSAISADEKFKKLKNGKTNRHVYYKCAKSKDHNCNNEPINEGNLIDQFIKTIHEIDVSEFEVMIKVKSEIERFKKFNASILGTHTRIKVDDIDIKKYINFILKEGKTVEKREILGCLSNKIYLKGRKIYVRNI